MLAWFFLKWFEKDSDFLIFVVFRLWSELTSWKKRLSFTLWGHIQLEDMFVYIPEKSETFCVPDWTYTVFQVLNK